MFLRLPQGFVNQSLTTAFPGLRFEIFDEGCIQRDRDALLAWGRLEPTRNVARSKSAWVTLGYSSRSSEVGEEEKFFIVVRSAHGNNNDFPFGFSMRDHYDLHALQPKCDLTPFPIVFAVVFKREQRTLEDMLSVDEIQSMLL